MLKGDPAAAYRNRLSPLVQKFLAKARKMNHDSQSYGGSTGGRKSLTGSTGINVMNQRASEQGAKRQIFDQEVKPFSAGREIWEGKKKLYEDLGT